MKVMLIDASMLMHRCYKKMDFLENSKGLHTGMEFGTLRSLQSLHKKYPKHEIIVCFDSPHNAKKDPVYKFHDYKANRSHQPDEFYKRVGILKEFLKNHYYTAEVKGYEADDIIFSLASRIHPVNDECLIYSNDNDLLAAVRPRVSVLKSFQSKLYVWDIAKVCKEYGVVPEDLILYRSFLGDKSDNLKGVDRLPKKTLASIVTHTRGDMQTIVSKIMTSTAWSTNQRRKLHEFVSSGRHKYNLDMMTPRIIPDLQPRDPGGDRDLCAKLLTIWEISSLDVCNEYDLAGQFADEEF